MNDDYNNYNYDNNQNQNSNNMNNLVYHYTEPLQEDNNQVPYNTLYTPNGSYKEKKERNLSMYILPFVIFLVIIGAFVGYFIAINSQPKKERTFMIYMVGSDLESKSKQGTFSLSDIVGENIDLQNNNVVLIAGGASKWHNFVDPEEIGIYVLTRDGFKKKKKLPVQSMGSSDVLEEFLKYAHDNYRANKYDMIFWNHGLGAIGIEQDELAKDFLTISELDNAFKNSVFAKDKLELTIFYNCLASNLHIANIMKNYSDYMVASEEIFYLSKILNRLNFLEDVKKDDSAYDIAKTFVDQSDKVVTQYNNNHTSKIDSTLSIIDLSKIDSLNNKLNSFIKTIDIKHDYYSISYFRRKTHTYGMKQTYDYDTVDLYNLVEALGEISDKENYAKEVLDEIDKVIKYTSNFNNYSKGISIYFPYFGSESAIQTHLSLFSRIFNDDYYNFINNFYQIRSGTKRARRNASNNQVNKLTNRVVKNEDGSLSITLTEEEKKNYQGANIYLFNKNGDNYELLLESNKIELKNNELVFKNNKLLKIDDKIISYINNDDIVTYGNLENEEDNMDAKLSIINNKINEVILDSDNYISSSILDYDDFDKVSFYNISYQLFEDGMMNEYFKDTIKKSNIEMEKKDIKISLEDNTSSGYYVLIELTDMYNDPYYSELELIN